MQKFIICTLLLITISCGKEDKTDSTNVETSIPPSSGGGGGSTQQPNDSSSYAMIIPTSNLLPDCDSSSIYKLVYLVETSEFQTCDGTSWVKIDIKGPKGDKGDGGVAGTPGLPGASWVMYSGNQKVGEVITNHLDAGLPFKPRYSDMSVRLSSDTLGIVAENQVGEVQFAVAPDCQFQSADCSGQCYYTMGTFATVVGMALPKVVYSGSDNSLVEVDLANSTQVNLRSMKSAGGGSCQDNGSATSHTAFESNSYNLPSGLSYPISSISYRAE